MREELRQEGIYAPTYTNAILRYSGRQIPDSQKVKKSGWKPLNVDMSKLNEEQDSIRYVPIKLMRKKGIADRIDGESP